MGISAGVLPVNENYKIGEPIDPRKEGLESGTYAFHFEENVKLVNGPEKVKYGFLERLNIGFYQRVIVTDCFYNAVYHSVSLRGGIAGSWSEWVKY